VTICLISMGIFERAECRTGEGTGQLGVGAGEEEGLAEDSRHCLDFWHRRAGRES
jgi:hypothetical protein